MTRRREKDPNKAKSFWRHPVTLLFLGVIVSAAVTFSFTTYPSAILLLDQIDHDHGILEDQRSNIMSNIDSLEAHRDDIDANRADIDVLKEQVFESAQEQTAILEALYLHQTGEEWEGSE